MCPYKETANLTINIKYTKNRHYILIPGRWPSNEENITRLTLAARSISTEYFFYKETVNLAISF